MNDLHLRAHQALEVAAEESQRAQARARIVAADAAEAEAKALEAFAEVRRIHLTLGATSIGMLSAIPFDRDLMKNKINFYLL